MRKFSSSFAATDDTSWSASEASFCSSWASLSTIIPAFPNCYDRAGGKKGTGPFSDSEPKAASPGKRKDSRAKRSPNGKGKAPGGSGSGGGRKAGPGALNAADALLEL